MIIVQGIFRVDPTTRDQYLAQTIEQMRYCRTEQGCQEYVIAADPVEADRVILSERWDTIDDLQAHSAALTRRREEAAAAGTAPTLGPLSREIIVYEATVNSTM